MGVSHVDAATAEIGEGLTLVAAKPAIATTTTTASALRRVDLGFATSGACGYECVWASSLDDLGLGSRACSPSGIGLVTAMLDSSRVRRISALRIDGALFGYCAR